MPEGKAPRFLIADGDVGHVLALLCVQCVEDLMKEQFTYLVLVLHPGREHEVDAGWPYTLSIFEFFPERRLGKAKRDAMMEITGIVEAIEASEEKARALLPLRYSPGYFLPFSPASFVLSSYGPLFL